MQYKVVEITVVTDENLEAAINKWVGEGYTYDGVNFAMRESSKRPAMAFLIFTKAEATAEST